MSRAVVRDLNAHHERHQTDANANAVHVHTQHTHRRVLQCSLEVRHDDCLPGVEGVPRVAANERLLATHIETDGWRCSTAHGSTLACLTRSCREVQWSRATLWNGYARGPGQAVVCLAYLVTKHPLDRRSTDHLWAPWRSKSFPFPAQGQSLPRAYQRLPCHKVCQGKVGAGRVESRVHLSWRKISGDETIEPVSKRTSCRAWLLQFRRQWAAIDSHGPCVTLLARSLTLWAICKRYIARLSLCRHHAPNLTSAKHTGVHVCARRNAIPCGGNRGRGKW